MREFLLAIAAILLIGLTLSLLINITITAAKLAIATFISFLLIASFIALAIAFSYQTFLEVFPHEL